MDFDEVLAKVLELLQRDERVSYRALKRRFSLDDEYLEDLKAEIIKAKRLAQDEDGEVLVWTGGGGASRAPRPAPRPATRQPAAQKDRSSGLEAAEAERRQLTVMFCDLVGSTSLSEKLDPEDLREVVRAYQETSSEAIQGHDGHIAQYLGDGLLVYFGYPRAHEDDAQRAVRSGLRIVAAVGRLNSRLQAEKGVQLAVRIGIHTGLVVVGEMGGGEKREHLALGDTPNIAARLEGHADPDTVVISEATHRIVHGFFDCEPMGAHTFKGVSQPLEIYRVRDEVGIHGRFEAAIAAGLTPLIGREEEVRTLLECWERAKNGDEQIVLVVGEAGLGKSRLLQVLKERLAAEPHSWLVCHCSPYYQNSPFYPVNELLQRLLRFQAKDPPAEKLAKLEEALRAVGFPIDEAAPLLASLLSIPLPDHYPGLSMTPQKQKQKTLDLLLAWLLKISEQQPLVFVIENLHWVDPSTLEHLRLLMEQGARARILILLTFRPHPGAPRATRSQQTEIALRRMSRHQVEQLVDKIATGNTLPGEVRDQVVTKTDGIPLFVEELTKMVLASGLLKPGNQQGEPGRVQSLAIPSTLQDSLMARLDRLGTVKEVVQLGATLGREFSYELIHAVSPLGDVTLQEELAKLVAAEVLQQQGVPPNAHYTFRQALIQDAAYQSLLKGPRRRCHQNIAETLETRFAETAETHPELVAHHYTEAGLQEQAIAYWDKAGRLATRRSANLEAIGHLGAGLKLVQSLPETSERNRRELGLQIALGVPMTATKGFAAPEVERVYARAGELCQDLGETPQLFPVLRGLWLFHMVRAELATAHELGRQLLRLAESVADSALVLEAHVSLGLTSFYRGEFCPARAHLERGIEIYRPEQHHSLAFSYGDDPGVVCLTYLALVLWQLGYPDRAVDRDREARELAQRVSHPFSIALALNFSARLHQFRRESEVTRERADATTRLSIEQGFTHWWTTGKILHGWALTEQGQGEDGIPLMREGLSAWQATGAEVAGPHCLALLAGACRKAGRLDEAATVLAKALDMAQKNGERLHQPELHRLQGELLAESAEGDVAGAESCFHQALVAARDQHAKSLELRAATSLGRLWQRQGKLSDARQLVKEVYGWFEEGFDTADLGDARELLEELGT